MIPVKVEISKAGEPAIEQEMDLYDACELDVPDGTVNLKVSALLFRTLLAHFCAHTGSFEKARAALRENW